MPLMPAGQKHLRHDQGFQSPDINQTSCRNQPDIEGKDLRAVLDGKNA